MTQANNTVEVVNTSNGQNPLILSLATGKGKHQGMTMVVPPNKPTRDKPKGEVLSLTLEQLEHVAKPLCRLLGSRRVSVRAAGSLLSVDDIKTLVPKAFKGK
jgi:hypothetical protein